MAWESVGAMEIAGRVSELSTLRAAVARSRLGEPVAVLVHGEAGIGKTTLVNRVCAESSADHLVMWGRCLNFGATSSPYLPLVAALEDWLSGADATERDEVLSGARGLEELLPSLGGTGASAATLGRLTTLIDSVLSRITARHPTVLVVDDLQWADATSLDVLAYVLSGLRRQPLAVLVTFRDDELVEGHPLHGWLGDVRRLPTVLDLPLGRLSYPETEEQIGLLLGAKPRDSLVRSVLARSQGNTYLTELLTRGLDPGTRQVDGAVPDVLRSALLAKWHRLGPPARQAARLLSVSGRPMDFADLAEVAALAGMPGPTVDEAVREGTEAGVIQRERSGEVWFRHPLLAEVLYASLMPGDERRLHAAFVDTFGQREGLDTRRLGDMAVHYEHAGRYDEAFDCALLAADQAARVQAFPEQAHLRTSAAQLWHRLSPKARERAPSEAALLHSASRATRAAGDLERAWLMVDTARDVVDTVHEPLVATDVLLLWSNLSFASGRCTRKPVDQLREAVALSEPFPDSEEHAAVLAELAEEEARQGMGRLAVEHADLAVEAAERSGSLQARSLALGARSLVHLGESSAASDAEECYRLALELGAADVIALACITRANLLEYQGRLAEVAQTFADGFVAASRSGLGGLGPLLATYAAHFLVVAGRLQQARPMLREALTARSISAIHIIQARGVAVVLAVRTGDLAEAEAQLAQLREVAPEFERHVGLHGPTALAEYLIARGRPEDALTTLQQTMVEHALAEHKYGDSMLVWGARAAADWAVRARDGGDVDAEHRAQEALADLVVRRGSPGGRSFVGWEQDPVQRASKALFAAERARCHAAPDAVERWHAAAESAQAAGTTWSQAVALLRLGEALLAAGRRADAAAPLRQAAALATRMGAEPLRDEVESLTRLARISLAEPALPGQVDRRGELPVSGPVYRLDTGTGSVLDRLTSRETEVLGYLVAGRSDAEIATALFISVKTVSVHVSNLLRKTGTSNRHHAAALAVRSGGFASPR